ncbi:hypothetical protein ACQP04_24990 [Pseudonocardia halophobica]|uniref:hypothetical protein n=1 Tax=Pseudonocardia halophobica TaxID=29401 RepID=UPI003D92DC71
MSCGTVKYLALGRADGADEAWQERFDALSARLGDSVTHGVGVRATPEEEAAPSLGLLIWAPAAVEVPADVLAAAVPGESWRPFLRLDERVVRDTDYADGSVLRLGLVRRLPELSRADFARHWMESHVPTVMVAGPLFDRYVVNIVEGGDSIDGVVEQQFPDEATCREHDRLAMQEKPQVRADMQKFIGGAEQFVGRVAYRWKA